MKLKKLLKTLKKINALVDQFKEEEEISQLELDLLKEYTRDFYKKLDRLQQSENVLRDEVESTKDPKSPEPRIEAETIPEQEPVNPKYKYKIGQISDDSLKKEAKNLAEKVAREQTEEEEQESFEDVPRGQVDIPSSDIPAETPGKKEPQANEVTPTPAPPEQKNEENDDFDIPALELEVEDGEEEENETPKSSSEQKSETPTEDKLNEPDSAEPASVNVDEFDPSENYKELFELEEVNDLSDKLSNAPIKDIRSSMGLNERVLTINELFGGNAMAFDKTVKELNQMDNFEEAKAYLSKQIVPEYAWHEENKLKKAKIFLKLVRRRYNLQ